ncbi:MAG: hypothetical protein ACYTBJ_05450 [Planctomycetota bacterium]|jgi:hypothetical protein
MANAAPATTSIENWDFHNFHVQQELAGGQFVSAETTLVAAGPPRLADLAAASGTGVEVTPSSNEDYAFPIGLLENVGLSQSKQLQRVFEIGSSRSYFIPGRVVGSVTLGRVLYHGPSLLKVLYAYYSQPNGSKFNFLDKDKTATIPDSNGNLLRDPDAKMLDMADLQSNLHDVQMRPGFDDFYLNLASDLFNQPCGLLFYFKNANDDTVGAVYLEECHLQGHQLSISSGSVLIMEGASMQFDRLIPVKMRVPTS